MKYFVCLFTGFFLACVSVPCVELPDYCSERTLTTTVLVSLLSDAVTSTSVMSAANRGAEAAQTQLRFRTVNYRQHFLYIPARQKHRGTPSLHTPPFRGTHTAAALANDMRVTAVLTIWPAASEQQETHNDDRWEKPVRSAYICCVIDTKLRPHPSQPPPKQNSGTAI